MGVLYIYIYIVNICIFHYIYGVIYGNVNWYPYCQYKGTQLIFPIIFCSMTLVNLLVIEICL